MNRFTLSGRTGRGEGSPAARLPRPGSPPRRHPWRAFWLAAALIPVALAMLGGCKDSMRRESAQGSLARGIAVVNNEKIPYESFLNEYQLFLTRWDRFIQNDPEKKQEIKALLLQKKIEELLIDQEARRKGIEVDEEEVNAATVELLSAMEGGDGGADAILGRPSLADWKRKFRRRLIHLKLIRQEVIGKIRLSSSELRAYYARNKESFVRPERVRVRHIAVGSRALYNRVIRRLKAKQKFVKLVRKYSITPDRLADGDLGYVTRGVLPPEFDKAIFKMTRIGGTSSRRNPVKTQMGYHIFRLEGREPAGLVSFRKALPEIRRRLLEEKQGEAHRRWLARLRDRATIHIDDTLLAAQ